MDVPNLFDCLSCKLINVFLSRLFLVTNDANFASYVNGNIIFNFVENTDNSSASKSLQSCYYKYGQKQYFSGFWITKKKH